MRFCAGSGFGRIETAGSVRGGMRRLHRENYARDLQRGKAGVRRNIKNSLLHCFRT
jgi:hypothetical protein